MASIRRRPLARQDLIEIWTYVAADNEAAADGVLDRIDGVLAMLADNPQAGRQRPELAPALRSFPVGSYVLFYLPGDDGTSWCGSAAAFWISVRTTSTANPFTWSCRHVIEPGSTSGRPCVIWRSTVAPTFPADSRPHRMPAWASAAKSSGAPTAQSQRRTRAA